MEHLVSRRSFLRTSGAALSLPIISWFPSTVLADGHVHAIPDVDSQFVRVVDDANHVQSIYSFNLDLSNEKVPKDNDLYVFAYSVVVTGEINSAGRSIKIVCNELIVTDGALFDLRGPEASPNFANQTAKDGQNPGAKGDDGANGGDGPNAGSLTVVCNTLTGVLNVNASGRPGGGAQSGGTGAVGQAGSNNPALGSTGAPGQPGGPAGKAGKPGKGGDGGEVLVYTVAALSSGQLVAAVAEGSSGSPGVHGHPGNGGAGGSGASGQWCGWK